MTAPISARARVLATHSDGHIDVELDGGPACPGCACGRLFAREGRAPVLRVQADGPVAPGSIVRLSASAGDVLYASLWLHGLPWLMLLVGAGLGAVLEPGDAGSFLGAVAGLATAATIQRRGASRAASPKLDVTMSR